MSDQGETGWDGTYVTEALQVYACRPADAPVVRAVLRADPAMAVLLGSGMIDVVASDVVAPGQVLVINTAALGSPWPKRLPGDPA